MNKLLVTAAGLLSVGLVLALSADDGRAQLPTAPGSGTPQRSVQQQLWGQITQRQPGPSYIAPWMQVPTEEPNRDLVVTPQQGPWMILLISYMEDENRNMAQLARDLILDLRNKCGVPNAYTFNYGLDERRKELERVRGVIEAEHAKYEKLKQEHNLPGEIHKPPVRVSMTRYKVEHGVLIGGYASRNEAPCACDRLRTLPAIKQLSPAKYFQAFVVQDKKKGDWECKGYVDPFTNAMFVRNPTLAADHVSDQERLDVPLLRRLNEDEPYSLFKNPRPFTLAVKSFAMPGVIQSRAQTSGFLQNIGIGAVSLRVDAASQNAHLLAEALRRRTPPLDAFVLHTQYSSIVTLGGFDSDTDPRMQSYREVVSKINETAAVRINELVMRQPMDPATIERMREGLMLCPAPRPMRVPH